MLGNDLEEDQNDRNLDNEPDATIPKWLWILIILGAVLAIPDTRYQRLFKMAEWTIIVFGIYSPYVLPYVRDLRTVLAFSAICVFHVLIMWLLSPVAMWDGYLGIGVVGVIELLIFSIPGGIIVAYTKGKRKTRSEVPRV